MANVKVLLGQFMKFRNVAEVEDRYLAPGGQLDKKDSFLEIALPNPELRLDQLQEVPTQLPPALPCAPWRHGVARERALDRHRVAQGDPLQGRGIPA